VNFEHVVTYEGIAVAERVDPPMMDFYVWACDTPSFDLSAGGSHIVLGHVRAKDAAHAAAFFDQQYDEGLLLPFKAVVPADQVRWMTTAHAVASTRKEQRNA
jgi:hypothetical protein